MRNFTIHAPQLKAVKIILTDIPKVRIVQSFYMYIDTQILFNSLAELPKCIKQKSFYVSKSFSFMSMVVSTKKGRLKRLRFNCFHS